MKELLRPFHLAIPVNSIDQARSFYEDTLGCTIGRQSSRWIDFNFFGHQLSAHLRPDAVTGVSTNLVDGEAVPVRHFGLVMNWQDWHGLVDRLDERRINYLIKPTIRFAGQPGEQATLFITDPSGNALEFKAFREEHALFAHN